MTSEAVCGVQWVTGTGPDDPSDTGIHDCTHPQGHRGLHFCQCGAKVGCSESEATWMTKIAEGLVPPRQFPKLPNAAGAPAVKAPWWRRVLRRFNTRRRCR